MRRTSSAHAMPGQDSFLDVAANLVGILIILVMVVGAHAKNAFIIGAIPDPPAAAPRLDVAAAEAAATDVERSMLELEGKINRQALEVDFRKAERNQLQTVVMLAEQELAKSRDAMTAEDRAQYDLDQDLIQSKGELERLGQSLTSVIKPSTTVLQHLPTPMAKTVFGHEIHFRLRGDRLAYVPFTEMEEIFQKDTSKWEKLRQQPRVEGSLPVIEGFCPRYILRREGSIGVLELIYFEDAEADLGEPFAEVLKPNSQLRRRLAANDPKRTTVTIWVYPDSFDQFRHLKTELFKLGYLTAARPHNFDDPIGALAYRKPLDGGVSRHLDLGRLFLRPAGPATR